MEDGVNLTLVEVGIVLAILGILIALLWPACVVMTQSDEQAQQNEREGYHSTDPARPGL